MENTTVSIWFGGKETKKRTTAFDGGQESPDRRKIFAASLFFGPLKGAFGKRKRIKIINKYG
ncbi:hypothetical protein [uncultured Sneathiella sp.]|uniref:hypothetical protein n=1 Tax=uncultured Sneathiella sp. TaxID=879315 RepID=UPI0030D96C9E|tara:strand:- start:7986 stop:8171 length:186 start_codon:yes stop_codon:yes gene_type:complete